MDEVWVVHETVGILSENWLLFRRLRLLGHRLCGRRGANRALLLRLLRNGLSLRRLDSLQVNLLHSLQLHVCLRVTTCAFAKLAQLVILVKVKLGALQILVDILTKHLFKISVIGAALSLLSAHAALSQLIQIGSTVSSLGSLVTPVAKTCGVLTTAHQRATVL